MSPKRSGTIGRCGFVDLGMTCWWKCVTAEVGLGVSYMFKIPPRVTVDFLFPLCIKDAEFASTMSAYTPPYPQPPCSLP